MSHHVARQMLRVRCCASDARRRAGRTRIAVRLRPREVTSSDGATAQEHDEQHDEENENHSADADVHAAPITQ
jgi:hypothetical protein